MRAPGDIKLKLANGIATYATTNLPGLWATVERHPDLHRRVNAMLIDRAILKIPTRPNPLSTKAGYTSWASLTDRTYDSRHLPAAEAPLGGGCGERRCRACGRPIGASWDLAGSRHE